MGGFGGSSDGKWARIITMGGASLLPEGILLCRQCAEEKIIPMVLKKVIKQDGNPTL